ncbi:hypothetical protein GCM10023187_29360 [Nibrella viscosa]|uniref:Cell division protein FtsZ n=1 Tax=Nibrella viscosa TaxID=1084524 RepID=A0ABP8KJC6_9BACT
MLDHGYTYEIPDDNRPIIKVIGVGGGGSNAVKHMVEMEIKDVDFAVCNTDRQALLSSPVKTRLQLGAGLGAGTDPEVGREAAEASLDDLRHLLGKPVEMVFITAGMGGGTGTGAAPVVAQLARDMGLLTVAIVTAPYKYEGKDKKEQAMKGIELLKKSCDTVLVVLNDKLAELYGKLPLRKAFAHADNVLATAVKSIAEIITTRGDVNADFMDVKKVLQNAGQSVMGSADAEGEDRAIRAIEEALNSPLLNDRDIRGAKRILLTISSSSEYEVTLDEQTTISDYILTKIGEEARMFKLGAIFDDSLGPKLRVTVIAAGFDTMNEFKESLGKPVVEPVVEEEPEPEEEPMAEAELNEPEEEAEAELVGAAPQEVVSSTDKATTPTNPVFVHAPTTVSSVRERDVYADVLLAEERPEDSAQIQQMITGFLNGRYMDRDLDTPTYQRYKVMLYELPLGSENDLVRMRLND